MPMKKIGHPSAQSGYTLIELVVAIGLFALVMTLVSGAYIVMINLTEQAQGTATGIDNLSFALETMTRSIRTGTGYNCGFSGGDCPNGENRFYFTNTHGNQEVYTLSNGVIMQNSVPLTDPSVNVSSLLFYVSGTNPLSAGDYSQPHVTIIVSGTVSSGGQGKTESFTIETGATMRSSDL